MYVTASCTPADAGHTATATLVTAAATTTIDYTRAAGSATAKAIAAVAVPEVARPGRIAAGAASPEAWIAFSSGIKERGGTGNFSSRAQETATATGMTI